MTTTTFVDGTTPVVASWLNDVNTAVYNAVSGTSGVIARTNLAKFKESISVKDFGAVGDGTTDDSAAFTAALASVASLVYIPAGTYNIKNIVIPLNKRVYGDGKFTTILKPTTSCTYVLQLSGGAYATDIQVHGNTLATTGIQINGDYVKVIECHVQNCVNGYYNVNNDVWELVGTSSSNNTYSIYSANRGINCVIDRHESRGSDTTGLYMTYSTQQPQGLRLTNSLLFGNTTAINIAKDSFSMVIANNIIDGCTGVGILLGVASAATSTDFIISGNYIGAQSVGIDINQQTNHVQITGNDIANGSYAIRVLATSSLRSENIVIRDNYLGLAALATVQVDSPNGCLIAANSFAATGAALDLAVLTTFSGTNPKIMVRDNVFRKSNSVSAINTDCYDNIGYVTKSRGVGIIPASATSVVISHNLSITPTGVICTPFANQGSVYADTFTSTTFTFRCTGTNGVPISFSWVASAD